MTMKSLRQSYHLPDTNKRLSEWVTWSVAQGRSPSSSRFPKQATKLGRTCTLLQISGTCLKERSSTQRWQSIRPSLLKLVSLRVAGCRLQVAGCRLQVVDCRLQVVGCWLQVAGCRLQVAGCWLQVVGCWLQVAGCRLQVAGCRLQVVGCRL